MATAQSGFNGGAMMNHKHTGVGKSSFDSIDAKRLFSLLSLQKDFIFLDLGCGRGDYAVAATEYIGEQGRIYALDKWEEGINHLKETLARRGIGNITALQADISQGFPIENRSVDICLMAGVFHHLVEDQSYERALAEIKRILKPEGILAIVEFKKIEGPPGPPIRMRFSSKELEKMIRPSGFREKKTLEIGLFHYLTLFSASKVT